MLPSHRPTRHLFRLDTPKQRRIFRRQVFGICVLLIVMGVALSTLPLWLAHLLP